MKRLLISIVIFLIGAVYVYAQGELDKQQKVFFRNERSFGFLLNTDGFGGSYRAAKRIDYLNKRILEIDGGILKSLKESRQRVAFNQGGSYVFGKLNSTFFLRAGYGRQHEIYSKADLGGIAIRYFYTVGPVVAIYKPIYYRIYYPKPTNPLEYEQRLEKFDVNAIAVPQDIYGRAPFTKGLSEIKFMPGVFAKVGFNFEYSREDKAIHAIEIGTAANLFPKEIPIMAVDNKQLFLSLFVSYRFGMILDPLHPENNSIGNIFKRKRAE
jgi:hypothetical protein